MWPFRRARRQAHGAGPAATQPSSDGDQPAGPSALWLSAELPGSSPTGLLVYSTGLAEALADTGVDVVVLGMAPTMGHISRERRVRWWPVHDRLRGGWRSVLSRLPNLSYAASGPRMRAAVADALSSRRWDIVVVDHLQMAWALRAVRAGAPDAVTVFVTHNHEASVRREVVQATPRLSPRRVVLGNDARKAARLERRTVAGADLVTAITAADVERFAAEHPDARIVLLEPGYDDPRRPPGSLAAAGRRVGIIGSFEWHVKAQNLERFVEAADDSFADAGIELVVGGRVSAELVRRLGSLRATSFAGWVPSVSEFLAGCRIGVVAEALGGGFKLKTLDYVFNRVPIAALEGSAEGLPLTADDQLLSPTVEDLVESIIANIDQLDRLEAMAASAYDRCRVAFSWATRGVALREAVDTLRTAERADGSTLRTR